MIEFALVLILLLTLIFGMIDYGNTLSDYQNLRQGVREAAREAASKPTQFVTGSTTCGPSTASTCFYNYIVARTGLSSGRLTVSWSSAGTFAGGTEFEVCVNYAVQSITGFAAPLLPSTLHADVEMRMEPKTSTFPVPSSPAVSGLSPCT